MNLTAPLCLDNIKTCCAGSQLAYTQPTITDTDSGESVLIQDCGDCTLIAFPGTHDLRDVLRDIDCLRLATIILGQPCSVHAGFDRTHNALIGKVIAACSVKETSALSSTGDVPPAAKRLSFFGNLAESQAAAPLSDSLVSLAPANPPKPCDASTETKNCQPRDSSPSPLNGDHVARSAPPISGNNLVAGLGSHWVGVRGENDQGVSAMPIFLTGHSKGAAVARRCALALLEKNFPIAGLITFGEPRGGDARYAAIGNRALAGRTLRITNAADPVPWLPAWLAGNRHCGPEAWLPPNPQSPIRDPQLVFGPRLWLQLLLNSAEIFRAWQLKDLAPLVDHHIDNYLHRIDAL